MISAESCETSAAWSGRLSRRSTAARRPAIPSSATGRAFSSSSSARSAASSVETDAVSSASILPFTSTSAAVSSASAIPGDRFSSRSSTALTAARRSEVTSRRSSCHGAAEAARSTAPSLSSRPSTDVRSSADRPGSAGCGTGWPFCHGCGSATGAGGRNFCNADHCSASALARSRRERLPCSTRISPIRAPVSRCLSSAASSWSLLMKPSSTKISPRGRRICTSAGVRGSAVGTGCGAALAASRSAFSSSAHCSASTLASSRRGTPNSATTTSPRRSPVSSCSCNARSSCSLVMRFFSTRMAPIRRDWMAAAASMSPLSAATRSRYRGTFGSRRASHQRPGLGRRPTMKQFAQVSMPACSTCRGRTSSERRPKIAAGKPIGCLDNRWITIYRDGTQRRERP